MKLLNYGVITMILASTLLFGSTYIPSIYEVPPNSNPKAMADDINAQYKAIMSVHELDKTNAYTIITKEDIEKKTSSIEIQKRALNYLVDVLKDTSYILSEEDVEKLAVQFQIIYDKAFVPHDIQPYLSKVREYSMYALFVGCGGLIIIVSIRNARTSNKKEQIKASVEKRKKKNDNM